MIEIGGVTTMLQEPSLPRDNTITKTDSAHHTTKYFVSPESRHEHSGFVALTAIKKSACSSSLGNLRQLELTGRMQIRFGPVIMKSNCDAGVVVVFFVFFN